MMNYAKNRLDRRAQCNEEEKLNNTKNSIISDLKQAHHLLESVATDVPSSSLLERLKSGHELAGRTLRDCGYCRHASFHYGLAWMCDVNDDECAGQVTMLS